MIRENISLLRTLNGMKYLDSKIDFGHTGEIVLMKYS